MKTIGNMDFYSFEEVKDELLGKEGTPERDEYESDVEKAVNEYNLGETIKKARLQHNLTQEQLGKMIGVKKAQISRIESGRNLTISTIRRVFKAMGIATATLELPGVGKVELW